MCCTNCSFWFCWQADEYHEIRGTTGNSKEDLVVPLLCACSIVFTCAVKYRQSAPPSRPFVVVLWRWSAVCRSCDTDLVHIFHMLQSIRGYPYLRADTSSTRKPAKCALSTLRFSHRTNFVALCHTIFLSLGCKIKVGRSRKTGRSGGTLRYMYADCGQLHCTQGVVKLRLPE